MQSEIAQMICGFKLRQGKRTDTDKAWTDAMETAGRILTLTNAKHETPAEGAGEDDWSALERLAEMAAKRAPGEWERDTEKGEGEYGIGDETQTGYRVPFVTDARGKRLCDAHASDIALIEEDYSFDEDGAHHDAWDQASTEVLDFIAAANPVVVKRLITAIRARSSAPEARND